MSRGRRIYLYSVALFGMVASLISLISLLWRIVGTRAADLLNAEPLTGMLATPALPWLVLFVLALATWLFHISMANQAARPLTMAAAAERATPERKMYLYMGRLAIIAALVAQLWLLVREVVRAFLDGGRAGLQAAAAYPIALGAGAVVAFSYWAYMRYEAGRDGDLGQERGRAVLWRRAYTYLAALAGSLLAFGGGAELIRAAIRVLMTPLSGDTAWHTPASAALAALVVGLPLASAGWGAANRAATMNPPAETNALSRVLLRYDGVLVSTLVTLVTLGYLVEQVILRAISRPVGTAGRPLLGLFDWPWALAYLPVAALTWISFASGTRTDAAWGGESGRTAGIRRVVRYLLTAVSLVAFWYGLTEFARLILQVFLGADTSTASAAEWVQRFATSAAFLLIGAPAWWGHWWSQQMRVRTDDIASDSSGLSERASLVRRTYLVAVVLVGAAVVVAAAGFAGFLALNWQSASGLGGVRAAVAGATAAALVALFWTLVHGLTLRTDIRMLARERAALVAEEAPSSPLTLAPAAAVNTTAVMAPIAAAATAAVLPPAVRRSTLGSSAATRAQAPSANPSAGDPESRQYLREELESLPADAGLPIRPTFRPAYALAVIDGADGILGAMLMRALRAAFPDVVLWPVGLNATAHGTMLSALGEEEMPPVLSDALSQVAGILAPSDVMIPGALDGEVTVDLVESLADSPAQVMLLPPRDARLRWVAAPDWSMERWVENAVVEAGNVLEAASDVQ